MMRIVGGGRNKRRPWVQEKLNPALLGIDYNAEEWSLFIDSSKRSLKGVLLNNGNKYASIPVAHSVHLKET